MAEGSAPVSGRCDPGFGVVADAFSANLAERGELGAGLCVMVAGEPVVDLVGGYLDLARTWAWTPDTLVDVYSAGKPVVAVLLLQLIDQGLVGLDDPVASVWPEYAVNGKASTTLRHALCHLAGVPAIRERLVDEDLWHFDTMAAALAATEPFFEPGTTLCYHTNTYGHLIGGLIHRVSGELPGTRLEAVSASIGADLHCGLAASDQLRCAEVTFHAESPGWDLDALQGHAQMVALSYFNPPGYSSMGVVNTADWRAAQVPSTNMHATAKGLATFYRALLEPDRLVSTALLAEATTVQSSGHCPVLGEEAAFGLGFKPTSPRRPFGTSPRSFGHFGTGGAVGFADPDNEVAFGYAMNDVIPRWQSTRNRALIDALYAVL